MSIPSNELDDLSIYTYHVAIFIASTQDKLESEMNNFDWETKTSRNDANNLCILNSVCDPFQLIQELKIVQVAPSVGDDFKTSPFGEIALRIVEPGNCMFLNKIAKLMKKLETKALAFAVWGFLIKFVGRTPENEIVECKDVSPVFAVLTDIRSSFNHMGSTYDLSFVMADTIGVGQTSQHSNSIQFGMLTESVNISEVETLEDGIKKLQEAAQKNYDEQVKISSPNAEMRKVKYNFYIDPDINIGKYKINRGGGSDSDARNETKFIFNFQQGTPIAHAIETILKSCPDLMKEISEEKEAWRKPYHNNGKMFQILSSSKYNEDDVEIIFKVSMHNGLKDGDELKSGETKTVDGTSHTQFEFDFYFSDKYNTDVINFDLTSNTGLKLYLCGTPRLQIENSLGYKGQEHSGAVESGEYPGTKISKNLTYEKEKPYATNDVNATGDKNDVLLFASMDNRMSGSISDYNKERTAALESLVNYMSVDSAVKTLNIRGNLGLLKKCLESNKQFGSNNSFWVKLNIFSRDDETGQRDRYFYNGAYFTVHCEHNFSEGKFVQTLTLQMMDFEWVSEL